MRFLHKVLLAILSGAGPGVGLASIISLETHTRIEGTGDSPIAIVRVTNKGDEAARSIYGEIQLRQFTNVQGATNTLAPGESCELQLALGSAPETPGTYPVALKITYTDANGYPFSALSVITFSTPDAAPTDPLTVGVLPARFAAQGNLRSVVRLVGEREADVRLRLVLPDEIDTPTREVNTVVTGGKTRPVEFALRNISAQPGSQYPVFVIAEYDLGDQHHAVVRSTEVSIIARGNLFQQWKWLWVSAIVILLVVLVGVQFAGRSKPSA